MNNITITRRFRNIKSKMFRFLLTREDFRAKAEKLDEADLSVKPSIKSELVEMFKVFNIKCECNKEDSYYKKLVESSELPSFHDSEERIMKIMYELFKVYPTPEDYMKRIVDRLQTEDSWKNDTVRLRILKQFIKYGNYMSYKSVDKTVTIYGGKQYIKSYAKEKAGRKLKNTEDIIANIDDHIFDVLKKAEKSQKQPRGKYALISMSEDLAKGRFKTDGATRRDLYFFAMVFNMTYYCENSNGDTMLDYNSDIEKNLFEDYYTNNLMRFITEVCEEKLNAFELDPSGAGINYKNFAEMVYIYFISGNYTAVQKIQKSCEMIERLKFSGNTPSVPEENQTMHYHNIFTDEILSLSETDFEKFIADNYDCNVRKGEKKSDVKPALQVNISQKTAFDIYNELIDGLEYTGTTLEECDYGLWFTDTTVLERSFKNDNENKQNFMKLLDSMNIFLADVKKITSDEKVTRTSVITAYYYYYNSLNSNKNVKKNFVDVWNDYTNSFTGLNSMLEEIHYQPISERNIFDIAVIFSSYVYLATDDIERS